MSKSLLLSLVALVGCASRHPSVQPLPTAWHVDKTPILSSGMPNYALAQDVFARVKTSTPARAPASSDEALVTELEKRPSLRRLYFRSLYQQWQQVAQLTSPTRELRTCPQYHHDKITLDESRRSPFLVNFGVKPTADLLAYYPEWALPVKRGGVVTTVWSTGEAGLLPKAIASHETKLRRELKELCESGVSDGYFRLENMATYLKDPSISRTEKGLVALLKIPVFSTMLLMKSVEGSFEANFTGHELALLEEVQGQQLQQYIVELRRARTRQVTGRTGQAY